MGKSLYIQRMTENSRGSHIVRVSVHGPDVTADSIMDLHEHNEDTACSIFHFDLAPTVRTYCIIITISLPSSDVLILNTCMHRCCITQIQSNFHF